MTSFVVDNRLAVDAGSIGLSEPFSGHKEVEDVVLTHSHIDHVASLAIFIERVYTLWRKTTRVYGHPHTIDSLRRDIFNGRLYPDLLGMEDAQPPFLEVFALEPQVEREIGGYRLKPVDVRHTVPCFGYILQSNGSTIVFGGDSGPTRELWALCREISGPLLVVLECSFPNRLEDFALMTGHLTPKLLAAEVAQLPDAARVLVTHIKADFYREVVGELEALRLRHVEVGDPSRTYEIG